MIQKTIAMLLLLPLLVIPFMLKAEAEAPRPEISYKDSWTKEEVKLLVDKYADKYGVSRQYLHRVVACESGYNHKAYNGKDKHKTSIGSLGVSQFAISTFTGYAQKMGKDYTDPYNPEQALDVMGYMFSKGLSYHWTCAR